MAKKSKQSLAAAVDSSYTLFFLIFASLYSYLFASMLTEPKSLVLWVTFGFALLTYILWDIVRQLFSVEQTVFLGSILFLLAPFIYWTNLSWYGPVLGYVVWIFSLLSAGICELIYNNVRYQQYSHYSLWKIFSALTAADTKVDKAFIRLSDKQTLFNGYAGVIFGILLVTIYISGIYVLQSSSLKLFIP